MPEPERETFALVTDAVRVVAVFNIGPTVVSATISVSVVTGIRLVTHMAAVATMTIVTTMSAVGAMMSAVTATVTPAMSCAMSSALVTWSMRGCRGWCDDHR